MKDSPNLFYIKVNFILAYLLISSERFLPLIEEMSTDMQNSLTYNSIYNIAKKFSAIMLYSKTFCTETHKEIWSEVQSLD